MVRTMNVKPDLLLTDLVMPGISGFVLAGELMKTFPNLEVIFISGYPEERISPQGILDVAAVFIRKPFSIGELAAHCEAVLKSAGRDHVSGGFTPAR